MMKINLTDMLYALSFALDTVEGELTGVITGHGERVAYFSLIMAKQFGIEDEELLDFVGCAILHDNAVSEYIREEFNNEIPPELLQKIGNCQNTEAMKKFAKDTKHEIIGERNISLMPFRTDVKNIILYHHENANGSGPLGKKSNETNLKSQILHLADLFDMVLKIDTCTEEDFLKIKKAVNEKTGILFSRNAVSVFNEVIDFDLIKKIRLFGVNNCLRTEISSETKDYTDQEVKNIAEFFAKIIDYKSSFTRKHSMGVADKCEIMAHYFGFSAEKTIRFYLAGAFHDLGKLVVHNDILEKPDRLSESEFETMKNHAAATRKILSSMTGMEDITKWASNHHEKLDGSGYPLGLTEKNLSLEERIMACADIYQALTEPRPYKEGFGHEKAISIMTEMAQKNQIDSKIVTAMDEMFR